MNDDVKQLLGDTEDLHVMYVLFKTSYEQSAQLIWNFEYKNI